MQHIRYSKPERIDFNVVNKVTVIVTSQIVGG